MNELIAGAVRGLVPREPGAAVAVWATLHALAGDEAARPREVLERALAEGLEADLLWTRKFLDRLAAQGLIRETAAGDDAGAVLVELTPKGDDLYGRLRDALARQSPPVHSPPHALPHALMPSYRHGRGWIRARVR